jgi:hypothetical protein
MPSAAKGFVFIWRARVKLVHLGTACPKVIKVLYAEFNRMGSQVHIQWSRNLNYAFIFVLVLIYSQMDVCVHEFPVGLKRPF